MPLSLHQPMTKNQIPIFFLLSAKLEKRRCQAVSFSFKLWMLKIKIMIFGDCYLGFSLMLIQRKQHLYCLQEFHKFFILGPVNRYLAIKVHMQTKVNSNLNENKKQFCGKNHGEQKLHYPKLIFVFRKQR